MGMRCCKKMKISITLAIASEISLKEQSVYSHQKSYKRLKKIKFNKMEIQFSINALVLYQVWKPFSGFCIISWKCYRASMQVGSEKHYYYFIWSLRRRQERTWEMSEEVKGKEKGLGGFLKEVMLWIFDSCGLGVLFTVVYITMTLLSLFCMQAILKEQETHG